MEASSMEHIYALFDRKPKHAVAEVIEMYKEDGIGGEEGECSAELVLVPTEPEKALLTDLYKYDLWPTMFHQVFYIDGNTAADEWTAIGTTKHGHFVLFEARVCDTGWACEGVIKYTIASNRQVFVEGGLTDYLRQKLIAHG